MTELKVPVSVGELIDKITILEIKSQRIADPDKLANVRKELAHLSRTWEESPLADADIGDDRAKLKRINETLWDIEDDIRRLEAAGDFSERFVELARAVYLTNDERAAAKRRINEATGSALVEEKSYADYRRSPEKN
jgi:hypothetical protein